MKKAIKIAAPYLLAVVWFVYCLSEIEESVLNHFGYEWYVINSNALALFSLIALLILRLFKKKIYVYYFVPVVFVIMGLVLNIVGSSIPCCTGG